MQQSAPILLFQFPPLVIFTFFLLRSTMRSRSNGTGLVQNWAIWDEHVELYFNPSALKAELYIGECKPWALLQHMPLS